MVVNLPDGLTIDLAINNRTSELVWQVGMSEEYITRVVLSVLDERIKRAEIALKVCRHTKRKHRLTKLYNALVKFRKEQSIKLQQSTHEGDG